MTATIPPAQSSHIHIPQEVGTSHKQKVTQSEDLIP